MQELASHHSSRPTVASVQREKPQPQPNKLDATFDAKPEVARELDAKPGQVLDHMLQQMQMKMDHLQQKVEQQCELQQHLEATLTAKVEAKVEAVADLEAKLQHQMQQQQQMHEHIQASQRKCEESITSITNGICERLGKAEQKLEDYDVYLTAKLTEAVTMVDEKVTTLGNWCDEEISVKMDMELSEVKLVLERRMERELELEQRLGKVSVKMDMELSEVKLALERRMDIVALERGLSSLRSRMDSLAAYVNDRLERDLSFLRREGEGAALQNAILSFLRREGEAQPEGVHVAAICAALNQEWSEKDVHATLGQLVCEGEAFTTIDVSRYLAT